MPVLRLHCLLLVLLVAAGGARAQVAVARDGDSIVFRGRVDAAAAAEFLRLAEEPGITRLVISSPGGLVGPALDMAEAIHARGLAVEVAGHCLSSCANYIFPAGVRRVLRGGTVGWHGNMAHVLYLQRTGQARWNERQIAGARELARREQDLFKRTGVDGFVSWFGKIPPYAVEDFYTLSPDDMALFGIHGVTVVGPPAALPADVTPIEVDPLALAIVRAEMERAGEGAVPGVEPVRSAD